MLEIVLWVYALGIFAWMTVVLVRRGQTRYAVRQIWLPLLAGCGIARLWQSSGASHFALVALLFGSVLFMLSGWIETRRILRRSNALLDEFAQTVQRDLHLREMRRVNGFVHCQGCGRAATHYLSLNMDRPDVPLCPVCMWGITRTGEAIDA